MDVKQNLKKRLRLCTAAAAAVMALIVLNVTVSASTTEVIDPDKTGSITITMTDSNGDTVGGGTLALYRVAYVYVDSVGQNSYVLTSDFQGCAVDLNSNVSSSWVAGTLEDYVNENDISFYQAVYIEADGVAKFYNLPVGVYLVIQTAGASGYYTVSSFVVTIPVSVDGTLVYDVDASPKVEATDRMPEEPEEPETPETPETPKTPETSETTILPQTGAILWPVFLIAGLGAAMLLTGWVLAFGNRRKRII